ncbi:hypothetical protein D6D19_01691 [Aureobasidium pullulans]|uniref:Uncharacterized protein n=1 Tax=Aureobasidium pullulans TaxID=5580 RepID=A0A4S9AGU4_AURPU|nr:hypothetical protein D6D19_01691 [Aureobasidium pullulans]
MDRAIKSDGKSQIQLDNIRESVDAIGVAFVQFGMDDEKVQLIADKNTLAQVRQSVDATGAAFIQFGMDDEKVQLIAEKVVDAPSHH